jgi:hypothetical protein
VITSVDITDSGSEWTAAPTITPPAGGISATLTPTLGGVQVVELNPVPSNAGTLELMYRAGVTRLTSDDDAEYLALDDEAVIGKAATLMSVIKRPSITDGLAAFHTKYMESLRQQGPGRVVNLAAWRSQDPVQMRQTLPRLDPRRP